MKFIDYKNCKFEIPNGIYLTCWLRDNVDNREFLKRWYDQVMMNKNRKAVYACKGTMIALFVNNVTKNG